MDGQTVCFIARGVDGKKATDSLIKRVPLLSRKGICEQYRYITQNVCIYLNVYANYIHYKEWLQRFIFFNVLVFEKCIAVLGQLLFVISMSTLSSVTSMAYISSVSVHC